LRICHDDFDMFVESDGYGNSLYRAVNNQNIPRHSLTSVYTWSEGVREAVYISESKEEHALENGKPNEPVFFDNTVYSIWVQFHQKVRNAEIVSQLSDDYDHFSRRGQILTGFVNFGNDIGLADISFRYVRESDGKDCVFRFGFEVLSSKLDYHSHWRTLVKDIEEEYNMLSLDYLKRTYHSFSQGAGDSFDLIWWNVFQSAQKKFIQSVRNIIERPRHRLNTVDTFVRADRIKRVSPDVEERFAEHCCEDNYLYRQGVYENSFNTLENRFLKYTVRSISDKFGELLRRVSAYKSLAPKASAEFSEQDHALRKLCNHPFFRQVGKFEGMRQESLILQRDVNYSNVYRTSILLRKSFSLAEGLYRMETKNIAELYEIWCFIQVYKIVSRVSGVEPEHCNRPELSRNFVYELNHRDYSRVVFSKDGVELAQVSYNTKVSDNDMHTGIKNAVSLTVPQKPDIVLQLTKNDLEKDMKLTYLFDAKYRLHKERTDCPPDDAINQMHRYRDAIYYKEGNSRKLKKEIVGGYILFPGHGNKADVEAKDFYKSIMETNIGAFALQPGNTESMELLDEFIKQLISNKSSAEIVSESIPQKGAEISVPNRVIVGYVKPDYAEEFENGQARLYYTGEQFPSTIHLDGLSWFVPWIKGKGIRDIYRITEIRTVTKAELGGLPTDDKMRLSFILGEFRHLYEDYRSFSLKIKDTYSDTILEELV